jgi:hypothetical protein
MIFYLIFSGILGLFALLTSPLPSATLLPLVGGVDTDALLNNGFGLVRAFILIFPFVAVVLNAFIYYFYFRIILLTLRVFRIIR